MHIKGFQSNSAIPHIEVSLVADQEDTQAMDYRGQLHPLSPGEIIDQSVFCGPEEIAKPQALDQIRRWRNQYGELEVEW